MDNLQIHLKMHGESSVEFPRQLRGIPHHQGTDCQDLGLLYQDDKASSPIRPEEGENLKSLTGHVREINASSKKSEPVRLEGKILTGKVVPSYRKERKWGQTEIIKNPTPTKKIDTDKINQILSQPKKPIKFPKCQEGKQLNTELFDRITSKTSVYCPPAKKAKFTLTSGGKKEEIIKLVLPKDTATKQDPQPSKIDFSKLQVDLDMLRKITSAVNPSGKNQTNPPSQQDASQCVPPQPEASTSTVVEQVKAPVPSAGEKHASLADPQPSTSGPTREERIRANDSTVARTSIFFDTLYKTKKGLDEIDQLIKRNEQLGADLLVSESDSDFDPDDLDLELFQ